MQVGRLNACAVAANWRLSTRNVVNLVQSQVSHTERPPYLFAARSSWCRASRYFVSDSWTLFIRREWPWRYVLRPLNSKQVVKVIW